MVTVVTTLTPTADTTPVSVSVPKELSGVVWCSRFPGSRDVEELSDPFRGNLKRFIDALRTAGVVVNPQATYRPKQRAYLMHYCVKVASGRIAPEHVPACEGVYIQWDHGNPHQSKAAAQAMQSKYGIVYPAAYPTRHSDRTAIDMSLSDYVNRSVVDAHGQTVLVRKESDLYPIGRSYGVLKLIPDRPHWSADGS